MTPQSYQQKLEAILSDYRGNIISSINNNYGENVFNAQDHAQRQALAAITQLNLGKRQVMSTQELNKQLEALLRGPNDSHVPNFRTKIRKLRKFIEANYVPRGPEL